MASASGSIYLAPREVWEKKIADHMKGVDPNWTAVDKFTTNYLSQEHEIVGRVINQIADAGLPPIACSPVQAKLLALAAYANLAAYALEIGTLGGLTAIRLAISNPQLRITSIELHEVYANIARQNIKDAGVEDRVEVLVGPALEVLSDLAVEIEEGKREKFGLTFIDADWENNWNYLNKAIPLSVPRAFIFLDNINVRSLASEQETGKDDKRRECVLRAGKDPRIDSLVLQTVGEKGWCGFMMCVVKE